MNNVLRYKGYVAHVTVEMDENILCGTVVNIDDTIHFEGRTPAELKRAFEESVNDYIQFCEERGEKPEKPYSGHLTLRLTAEAHREAGHAARLSGKSLNTFIAEVVEVEAKRILHQDLKSVLSNVLTASNADTLSPRVKLTSSTFKGDRASTGVGR